MLSEHLSADQCKCFILLLKQRERERDGFLEIASLTAKLVVRPHESIRQNESPSFKKHTKIWA